MTDASGELWAGRFSTPPALEARALGRSLEVDRQLVFEDVAAGIAHVGALVDAGLLSGDDAVRLTYALEQVRSAILAGDFAFDQSDSRGYVTLYGLPLKVWSAKQRPAS